VTTIHVQRGHVKTRREQDDTIDLEHKGDNRWE
jgi:hypothetical protein